MGVNTLKLTIRKDALNESIGHVSKAISSRTAIPILSGIKIEATHEGITLTASDTDISIQSFIPLESEDEVIGTLVKPGSVVLPAKFFTEIVKKLPSDDVELEVHELFRTIIRSGSSEIELVGLDAEEYPILPRLEENNMFTMNGSVLKAMIRQSVFAVSTNESTPVLTGVLWNLHEGIFKFVATDRHRLASTQVQLASQVDIRLEHIVIAGKTLNELSKVLPDGSLVDIVATDNQILFKMDSVLFYSRILDGTYPDTSKIISHNYKTEMVLKTKSLTDAIDRAYLLSREEKTNIVKLITIGDGSIEISSSSTELGKVTEQIDTKMIQGDELKISFNSKYMLDALKVIDSEFIHIGFTGVMSPIIIRPEDDDRMLHLILPYRTTN
jgi:DNA polymerase-3 subunit beta